MSLEYVGGGAGTQAFGPGKEQLMTFSSFAGADMQAVFGNVVFGNLQAITVGVQREVGPIYTMGSADPRGIAKNKRGIAGSLVFTQFDRDALLEALLLYMKNNGLFKHYDIYTAAQNVPQLITGEPSGHGNLVQAVEDIDIESLFLQATANTFRYVDQIPPFDITITMANDAGLTTSMRIRYVQLWSEATGFTIDDLVVEKTCNFIAFSIDPLGYDLIRDRVGIR